MTLQYWEGIKMLRDEYGCSLDDDILDTLEALVGWSVPELDELLYELLFGSIRDVEWEFPSRTSV